MTCEQMSFIPFSKMDDGEVRHCLKLNELHQLSYELDRRGMMDGYSLLSIPTKCTMTGLKNATHLSSVEERIVFVKWILLLRKCDTGRIPIQYVTNKDLCFWLKQEGLANVARYVNEVKMNGAHFYGLSPGDFRRLNLETNLPLIWKMRQNGMKIDQFQRKCILLAFRYDKNFLFHSNFTHDLISELMYELDHPQIETTNVTRSFSPNCNSYNEGTRNDENSNGDNDLSVSISPTSAGQIDQQTIAQPYRIEETSDKKSDSSTSKEELTSEDESKYYYHNNLEVYAQNNLLPKEEDDYRLRQESNQNKYKNSRNYNRRSTDFRRGPSDRNLDVAEIGGLNESNPIKWNTVLMKNGEAIFPTFKGTTTVRNASRRPNERRRSYRRDDKPDQQPYSEEDDSMDVEYNGVSVNAAPMFGLYNVKRFECAMSINFIRRIRFDKWKNVLVVCNYFEEFTAFVNTLATIWFCNKSIYNNNWCCLVHENVEDYKRNYKSYHIELRQSRQETSFHLRFCPFILFDSCPQTDSFIVAKEMFQMNLKWTILKITHMPFSSIFCVENMEPKFKSINRVFNDLVDALMKEQEEKIIRVRINVEENKEPLSDMITSRNFILPTTRLIQTNEVCFTAASRISCRIASLVAEQANTVRGQELLSFFQKLL
ncbi:hypothetical protein SNEBB_009534 [Seison nebaliae]|nr:hypothetical protein SNEBB_009534 [Seison nebaliae]